MNKRYDLGETDLEVNTILNPVHNYKYNKYLIKSRNSNNNYNYFNNFYDEKQGNKLKLAGNNIMNK